MYSRKSDIVNGRYINGKNRFEKSKILINISINIIKLFPCSIRKFILLPIFNSENIAGVAARYIYYKSVCPNWGDNIYIASKVVFRNLDGIRIGSNVSIHEFCYIDGYGGVEIGDDVSIAHSSSVLSFEHDWNGQESIKYNPSLARSVTIANGVWVGCGARILGGTSLGARMVVAAGAVVKGAHEGKGILAGVPAKLVRRID